MDWFDPNRECDFVFVFDYDKIDAKVWPCHLNIKLVLVIITGDMSNSSSTDLI